jgi:restriction endonuclease Mrr
MENNTIEVKSMNTIIDEILELNHEGYRQMLMCLVDRIGFPYSSDLPEPKIGYVGLVYVSAAAESHFLDSNTYALIIGRFGDVQNPLTIKDFRKKLRPYEHGILVITGKFSDNARKEAISGDVKITLIDGHKLVNLLATFGMFDIYKVFGNL